MMKDTTNNQSIQNKISHPSAMGATLPLGRVLLSARRGVLFLTALLMAANLFFAPLASAQDKSRGGVAINCEKLADAIFIAEGVHSKHPYGILKHYKKTTPRQACINTIKHAIKDWNGKGDFIEFLGSRYCPVGASNDPTGLNVNWVGNVKYHYQKGGGR